MILIESNPFSSFEESYRKFGGLLFEDTLSKPGFTISDHYYDPKETIKLSYEKNQTLNHQITSIFDRLDFERKNGLYPCGILYYELGYHFIEGFELTESNLEEGTPLLHITVFQKKKRMVYKNPDPNEISNHSISEINPTWSKAEYEEKWKQTNEFLKLGESYELNLCFPVHMEIQGDLFSTYQSLKSKQKTKFSVYYPMKEDGKTIISLSPELFFEVKGEEIYTEPMKGTILRGNTAREDQKNFNYLQTSEKEKAENVMITDLYRNDLGRIAKQGTVEVEELFSIQGLNTVWQMVSKLRAKLNQPFSWNTVLSALFPSGSVIGAPKHRSFSLLRSLEGRNRGSYTGAFFTSEEENSIPWIRTSVTIRTLEIKSNGKDHKAVYGIGSGVTVLSNPNGEYEECLSKLKVLTNPIPPPFEILETLRVSKGRIFLKDLHTKRMEGTAKRFGFPFSKEKLNETLEDLKSKISIPSRVRFLLKETGEFHFESTALPKRTKRPRIKLCFSNVPIDSQNIFFYHKTTNRSEYDKRIEVCKEMKVDDSILFDKEGRVLETNIRNLFYKQNGTWYTPTLDTGGLPGVFREYLLRKHWVTEKITFQDDLINASSILTANSVRGFERVTLVTE
ncbi:bifunctional chorismate-binding protein/class IV aminotransferase [Leptospira jelokensis]|uniref:bifunctional chorismate-binding protein/class IV aminotransferase n=1 Tax=Leptospira jelokensis TaxID=2484931 RepID=UPI001090EC96|nr:bifunctional chorismate-binding protein/class IV aminotransferase [Leptospira jelokensis]TGM04964.1 bifunctional aminodeoxychorismate synthase component I/aminotransferase [Leptospira jelokensis]